MDTSALRSGSESARGAAGVGVCDAPGPGFVIFLSSASILLIATFSRPLSIAWGVPLLNFLHFPLAVAAFAICVVSGRSQRSLSMAPLAWFTLATSISYLSRGTLWFNAILFLLLFVEPFLVAFAILNGRLSRDQLFALIAVALFCCLVQVPACFIQRIAIAGPSHDLIVGTFLGQRSGSHVAGALAALGGLAILGALAQSTSRTSRRIGVSTVALLLSVPVMSDSKVVLCASLLPALYVLRTCWGRAPGELFGIVCAIALVAFSIPSATGLIVQSIWTKIRGPIEVWDLAGFGAGAVLLGAGPGEGISRVALFGVPGYAKPGSPAQELQIGRGAVSARLGDLPAAMKSSILNPYSSWGSLAGDVGLLGVSAYGSLLLSLFARKRKHHLKAVSNALLIFVAQLSLFQLWFEEPAMTLVLFTLVAALSGVCGTPNSPALARSEGIAA